MEIMLAFSLMILFTLSTFALASSMQELKTWSLKELEMLKESVQIADSIIANDFQDISMFENSKYGNDTEHISIDPFVLTYSDYDEAWGRNSCYSRFEFDEDTVSYFDEGVDIGIGNSSTDIEARNGIAYLVADSTSSSQKDFFIIDARDPSNPSLVSSLNTGPGLSAIEVAGPYVFVAQASSVNQLQIIDIRDRRSPQLISQLKLPLPTPTTTASFASSIFYSKGYIYLGTQKWNGAEFSVIDVSNPYDPVVVGMFETNTVVNDIYIRKDRAYLAAADEKQLRVLDISIKNDPLLMSSFSPSGWQTQAGRTLEYFEDRLGFGRTVGGFNVQTNHEAFLFQDNIQQASKDIPGGVYGMLVRPESVFLLTHSTDQELQVWNPDLSERIHDMPLGSSPAKMSCDRSNLFFATGDSRGISILQLHE